MVRRKAVSFWVKRPKSVKRNVSFRTSTGKRVSFVARKNINKRRRVNFYARK